MLVRHSVGVNDSARRRGKFDGQLQIRLSSRIRQSFDKRMYDYDQRIYADFCVRCGGSFCFVDDVERFDERWK